MKKTLQCVLFLALAVLALVAMTVLGASAATHTDDATAIAAGDVVKVEYAKAGAATTEYYPSVSEAIAGTYDALANGVSLTLLGDVENDESTLISEGNVILNGNGYSVNGLSLYVSGGSLVVNGGNYVSSREIVAAMSNATVKIYGGYFESTDDTVLTAATGAELSVYGGYFHRTKSDGCGFIAVGDEGTANVFGGTYVADYTDTGYIFATASENATLHYYAFNGMGAAAIIFDATVADAVMKQDPSYTFSYNSVKVFGTVSLRLGDSVAKSGLRFTSYISKGFVEMVESLKDAETTVSYGTVVIPVKYLEGVNCFSIESAKKALVIPATSAGMKADEANGGIFIRASIYNLPHVANGSTMLYADDYAVTAYAEYVKDGKTVRHYANYDEELHAANMASLANDALQDVSPDEGGAYIYPVTVDGAVVYSKYTDAEREIITNVSTADASAQGLKMTLNKDTSTYSVTGYTGTGAKVIIPATYKAMAVTAIGETAFFSCANLTSITIPAGVTAIGSSAFNSCSSLEAVTFAEGSQLAGIGLNAFHNCSSLAEVTLPASVTSIGNSAFQSCSKLTLINIPASVTSIGSSVFGYCSSLTSIAIPASVTSFGDAVFYGCSSLTTVIFAAGSRVASIGLNTFYNCSSLTSIAIPASVTGIGDNAFYGCSSLEAVTFAEDSQLTGIGNGAFQNCSKLTSIAVPASVTGIGYNAFYGCSKLTSITIPAGVTAIGARSFYNCSSLAEINYQGTVAEWQAISMGTNWNSNTGAYTIICTDGKIAKDGTVTMDEEKSDFTFELVDGTYTVTGYTGTSAEIDIPATYKGVAVTAIGEYAFENCETLTKVTIPAGVTEIGWSAFSECYNLAAIHLPASLREIGYMAFESCDLSEIYIADLAAWCKLSLPDSISNGYDLYVNGELLTDLVIPQSITMINSYAFSNCDSIQSVTISKNVLMIGSNAFSSCDDLTSITFAEGSRLFNIGEYAFYGAEMTSIAIPASVTSIGSYAFRSCQKLTSVSLPEGLGGISASTFELCSALAEITIPASVTYIGMDAFTRCESLASVTFAEGSLLSELSSYAFRECGLKSISIPAGVIDMGYIPFYQCNALESITLPFVGATLNGTEDTYFGCLFGVNNSSVPATLKSVTVLGGGTIAENAFNGCSGITSITIGAGVTAIGNAAFYDCSGLTEIIYKGTLDEWQAISKGTDWDANTGDYTVTCTDGTIAKGEMPITSGLTFELINGTYTVTGYSGADTDVYIPATYEGVAVTAIGEAVFGYHTALTSVTIPASVTHIGNSAFYYCNKMEAVTFAAGSQLVRIDAQAFYDCSKLKSMNLEEATKLLSIGEFAFRGCSALTSLTIPASVVSIETSAFAGCTGMIAIENGISYVDKWAIDCDESVTSTSLRTDTVGIGMNAFYFCKYLGAISIPSSVIRINGYAFDYCISLAEIKIPASVISIGEGVFARCSALERITVESGNHFYYNDGNCLIEWATKTLIAGCKNSAIPADGSVVAIGASAFEGCTALTSIVLPDCITDIGDSAFANCTALTSITLPADLVNIGNSAFSSCSALTSITVPTGVTAISRMTFFWCTNLSSINYQGTVAEWQAISMGTDWNYNTGAYTIICTDGRIAKNGTVTMN